MAVDRIIWKMLLDFVVLACVAAPLLILLLVAEPYHRGYFADDQTLMLPYKHQTISEALLAGLGFAFIIVTVLLTEYALDKKGLGVGEKFVSGSLVPGWLWAGYSTIGIYTFGAACQQLTSNSAKYVIGRLRPHFFDVCNPVPSSSSQNGGYITEFTCQGTDAARLKDMRLSFPSAHSSFAMYTAVFFIVSIYSPVTGRRGYITQFTCQGTDAARLKDIVFFILYVQVKGKWRGSKLLRHAVQFLALMGAWYVGLSRVVDHMHHWSDVAVGFAVGALYAVIVFVYVLKPAKFTSTVRWENPPPEIPRPVLSR